MAKKSMIQREEKRKRLVKKYLDKRNGILKQLKQADSLDEIFALNQKFKNYQETVYLIVYVIVVGKLDDHMDISDILDYVKCSSRIST